MEQVQRLQKGAKALQIGAGINVIFNFEKTLCRSFLLRRKSKGPCVTPQVTVITLKKCPGKLTYCFVFSKIDFNQLLAVHGYRKNQV